MYSQSGTETQRDWRAGHSKFFLHCVYSMLKGMFCFRVEDSVRLDADLRTVAPVMRL